MLGLKPPADTSELSAGQRATVLIATALLFGGWYWVLPGLQRLVLPAGTGETWVIRPIRSARFGAATILTVASGASVIGRLRKRWAEKNLAIRMERDPFEGRPMLKVYMVTKACIVAVVCAMALVFYLFSWTTVGPMGIEERLPWGKRRTYSFENVAVLRVIPRGMRSPSLGENGPFYEVEMASRKRVTFGVENEGLTDAEMAAMAEFIAGKTGKPWTMRKDLEYRTDGSAN